ncbi:MAG TPA: hypothetical protein VLA09_08695, partial [Longimicrobiales bacterium]|nr:hypothetical protein [Longimicrobiales bacterium]
ATLGQYGNVGTVTATGPDGPVGDTDPSHYLGVDPRQGSVSVDLLDFTIASATSIEAGSVRISNESDAETITVLDAVYTVEYRGGSSWIPVGAACTSDPSAVFTFSTAQSVAFSCALSSPLPVGSTVRVTAGYVIAGREMTFLDRLTKSF